MAITPLPNPPSRSDPANFPERADAFMAALPQFASEANVLQEQVNEAAAAAEDYKDAAASSATAANQSADDAALSEGNAQGSAVAAAQARTDAQAARDLAKDWASKASGTVDGTAFLSAKQYAEQAAAGAGLPIYSPIPTADKGLIVVPDQGVMQWNATSLRYYSVQPSHGQCQFRYVSATECRLYPFDGNGLIINGRQYRIPAAGVPLPNTASPGANIDAYVFAYDNGSGAIALECRAVSAGSRAQDPNGVWCRNGDPSRTLVGMIRTTASNNFIFNGEQQRVLSWFSRSRMVVSQGSTTSVGNGTTALGAGVDLLTWTGEFLEGHAQYSANINTAGASLFCVINRNGSGWSPQLAATASTANASVALTVVGLSGRIVTDAVQTFYPTAATNGGLSTVTAYLTISTNG